MLGQRPRSRRRPRAATAASTARWLRRCCLSAATSRPAWPRASCRKASTWGCRVSARSPPGLAAVGPPAVAERAPLLRDAGGREAEGAADLQGALADQEVVDQAAVALRVGAAPGGEVDPEGLT